MKKEPGNVLAKKLARTMLLIGAATYKNIGEPYTWACGLTMRVYNDNRMMLGNYSHRWRIALGFAELFRKNKVAPDRILGVSTAGIAPAASTAQLLTKRLMLNHNGIFYCFSDKLWRERKLAAYKDMGVDTIISTCPFAIPYGVQYANKLHIGFAYVRKVAKDHGKQQQVEGNLKPQTTAILLYDTESQEERMEIITMLLERYGVAVKYMESIQNADERGKPLHYQMKGNDAKGKTIVAIEDLFSTGGSAAYEVYQARQAGMECNHCFSIFSYDFSVLTSQFSGKSHIGDMDTPCKIGSLLHFGVLGSVMTDMEFYTPRVRQAMKASITKFDARYKKYLSKNKKKSAQ